MTADALSPLARTRGPAARSTTADWAADAIREAVIEGRLPPGRKIAETELADALDVSRNTLREALGQLVTERILVRRHNRGISVAEPDSATVRDVYRARRLIEPAAVRAGEAFDATRVAAVRAAVSGGMAAAAAGDWDGVASANGRFHRALVALAGSPRLDQQMALLLAEMRLVFHRMSDVRRFFEPYLARNDAICALLEADDRARAATELTAYLAIAERQLLAAYETLGVT